MLMSVAGVGGWGRRLRSMQDGTRQCNLPASSTRERADAMTYITRLLIPLLLWAGPAQAASPAQVTVERQAGFTRVYGTVRVAADAATAWATLTDYDRMSGFVPGLTVSRRTGEERGIKLVEQRGEIRSGNLRMAYGNMLRIRELPPHGLDVTFVEGTFRNTQGAWRVEPRGGELTLSYGLILDAASMPPMMINSPLMPEQVRLWAEAMAAEIERRQAAASVRPRNPYLP
jgi:carbon monoxide dehydrogenase subunit G